MPIIQMRACDYRQVARERLSGNWGVAVLTSFVASLLGSATTNGYSSYFNLGFDSGLKSSDFDISGSYNDFSLRDLAEFLQSHPSLAAIITIWFAVSAICALASFILGGATKAGLCEFNKGLYDGNPNFNDLFKHYSIFGKAFLANLLVGIFTTLWTMLFIIPGIIASFSYSMTFLYTCRPSGDGRHGCDSVIQRNDARSQMAAFLSAVKLHRMEYSCSIFTWHRLFIPGSV